MKTSLIVSLLVLFLGICAAATFHSSGAIDEEDALTAAALRHGVAGSPPLAITSRALGLGVDLVRLVYAPTGLFRSMHLIGGFLLALAAALSALAAYRIAGDDPRAALAAGLFVGVVMLFGADLSGLAMTGGPLAVTITLLAGAAAAWTARVPLSLTGGLLLGLATTEHPFVLLLLPGFGALGRRASGLSVSRAAIGFALGLVALLLPILDSRGRPLLDFGDPSTPGRAISIWWDSLGGFARPGAWAGGLVEVGRALWRNAGPVGVLLGAGGFVALLRGPLPSWRLLLPAAAPALALIFGDLRDPRIAAALVGWSFLFLALPALSALSQRGSNPLSLAGLGPVAGAALLALTWGAIDQSAERGVHWARDSFGTLPAEALLLTGNPVHPALAADGERPDIDVVYLKKRSTLAARRSGREVYAPLPPGDKISGKFLHEVVGLNQALRPVVLDPALFAEAPTREATLGNRWAARPHGIAFRVLPEETAGSREDEELRKAVELWGGYDLTPGTPPSALRGGLTGDEFYARGLLQSASVFLELDRMRDAEREFLFALTLEEANQSLAAFGLGRLYFEEENIPEAVAILEEHVNDSDAGAWTANRLLASARFRLGRFDEGLRALDRAIRLTPPDLVQEREEMELLRENIRARVRASRGG